MTTIEEMNAALEELKQAVKAYNVALDGNSLKAKDEADAKCHDAKAHYNDAAKRNFYDICLAASDPMYEACKRLTYKSFTYKDKTDHDTGKTHREIDEIDVRVKVKGMANYAADHLRGSDVKVGHDEKWATMIARFTMNMTCYAAKQLGYKPAQIKNIVDTIAVSDAAKKMILAGEVAEKVAKGEKVSGDTPANPVSNTQIQKQIQSIVTAMLGTGRTVIDTETGNETEIKFKVTSHDADFIRLAFGRKSRNALSIVGTNLNDMEDLMTQVCHRIILNKDYRIEYRKLKNNG